MTIVLAESSYNVNMYLYNSFLYKIWITKRERKEDDG